MIPMKTEMKKNNKMFLALAVVAALAMVSVAGVALQSDDSDAAALLNPMGNGENSTTIIEDSTVDARFYINLGANQNFGVQFIKIAEGITASGTISIGTADDNEGKNYKEYATVKLDGVKNAVFTLIMTPEGDGYLGMILVGDEAKVNPSAATPDEFITDYKPVEGTIEVTKGMLMGGAIRPNTYSAAEWLAFNVPGVGFMIPDMYNNAADGALAQFTGTMKAADAVFESAYTFGLALSVVDGAAAVFNEVCSADNHLPYIEDEDNLGTYIPFVDRSERIVTLVSGTVKVAYPEGVANTGGASFGMADVNMVVEEGAKLIVGDNVPKTATTVTIKTPGTTVAGYELYLIPESGAGIAGVAAIDGTDVAFTFDNVKLNTDYTLVGMINNQAYFSTFSVDGAGIDYVSTIGTNSVSGAVAGTGNLTYDGTDIIYNYADLAYCLFAATYESGALSIDESGTTQGKIATDNAGEKALLLFVDNGGNYLLYMGDVTNPNMPTNDITGTGASTAVVSEGNIALESIMDSFYLRDYAAGADDYTLTVKGDIEFVYTSTTNRGQFTSDAAYSIDFEGSGMLTYGTVPQVRPVNPLNAVQNMNAAYYFVNEGSETRPTSTTFYYTTINNALTQSNDITIIGTVTILEDVTLVGPVADQDTKINIATNANLLIGDSKHSPKVSIPASTTVTKGTGAGYEVVSGQAIYDVKPPRPVNEPASDVLLEGDKFIYTDLWTAFDISQSGQTIKLRQAATLDKDATLKEGVSLNNNNFPLTIDEDVTFIVNGTYDCQSALTIDGTVRVNGVMNITGVGGAHIASTGAIDVMSSGVVNVGNDTTAGNLTCDTEGVVSVAGTFNVVNGTAQADELELTGKISVKSTASFAALTTFTVGAMPEIATKAYSNPAVIEGKINVSSGTICTTYGDFALTATGSSANVTAGGTFYSTKYMVGEVQLCTVYTVDATYVLPMVNGVFKDIIISDWNNMVELNGDSMYATGPTISTANWTTAYAVYTFREFKVTFEYTPGVTWTYNGKTVNTTDDVILHYGDVISVNVFVAEGYAGTPTLTLNGNSYKAGDNVTIDSNIVFKATGVHVAGPTDTSGWTLIEILLVVIVVIIGIIAIIVAIRLLRS